MLNQWEIEDSCKAHSKINRKLLAIYDSNDVVHTKDGPFWKLGRWMTSFGGMCSKNPQKGARSGIFKPNKHNIETHISRPRFERFWWNLAYWCSSTLLTVLTVEKLKFLKSKIAVAAILKNIKITISRLRFKRFLWNLVRWHTSTVLTVPTVKNLKFQKSKMAA